MLSKSSLSLHLQPQATPGHSLTLALVMSQVSPGPGLNSRYTLWFITTKNIFLSCRNIKRILIWYLVKDKISVWFQLCYMQIWPYFVTVTPTMSTEPTHQTVRVREIKTYKVSGGLVSDYNNDGIILSYFSHFTSHFLPLVSSDTFKYSFIHSPTLIIIKRINLEFRFSLSHFHCHSRVFVALLTAMMKYTFKCSNKHYNWKDLVCNCVL